MLSVLEASWSLCRVVTVHESVDILQLASPHTDNSWPTVVMELHNSVNVTVYWSLLPAVLTLVVCK